MQDTFAVMILSNAPGLVAHTGDEIPHRETLRFIMLEGQVFEIKAG